MAGAPGSTRGVLLGVDIGGTKVALGTAVGRSAARRTMRLPSAAADDSAEALLDRVVAAARDLVEQSTAEWQAPLTGVGVVCPGVVLEHGILLAPNNPGWETVRLRETFQKAFPQAPIGVMNDVKAGALAELTRGALSGIRSGLFLNLGTGVAAAIVVNGALVEGGHGAAGEIGYQVPGSRADIAHSDGHAPLAYTDGHAPLEELVSGRAIADRASAALGRKVDTATAFTLAATEPAVRAIIDEALELLAVHVANLAVALDPERIVLGGGLVRQAPLIVPRLTAALGRIVPFPPEVRVAALPDDVPLEGAFEVAAGIAGTAVQQ